MNLYDTKDQLRSKQVLTIWAVAISTISLFFYEGTITWNPTNTIESGATLSIIGSFAFMRVVLFILGSTLKDKKAKNIAFYSAVIFTFLFVAYFYILYREQDRAMLVIAGYYINIIETKGALTVSNLILIALSALTLLPAEWILGRTVNEKENIEAQIKEQNRQQAQEAEEKRVERQRQKEEADFKKLGLQERIRELEGELSGVKACEDRVRELEGEIESLNLSPKFPSELIGSKIILQSGQMIRYCPKCYTKNIQTGNKVTEMYCKATLLSGGICNTQILKK